MLDPKRSIRSTHCLLTVILQQPHKKKSICTFSVDLEAHTVEINEI